MGYTFVPLSNENIEDLTYLYKHVFGNKMTLKMVKTKYDTSYLKTGYFGHLAYYQKQPVAFHGAIPVLMQHHKKQELAAQYGDAMTLPKHTGNGLFTKLGKLTDKKLKEAGIRFVWGFPNQNSEYGYLNKLDWIHKERMQRYTLKIGLVPLEKIARKFSTINQIYDQYVLKAFKDYETNKTIPGSVFTNEHVVSIARNKGYYNYKSFNNNFTIEIDTVLFWIKIKNGLMIGDVKTSSEKAFYLAFKKLKKIALKAGIREINIQASPDTTITKFMNKQLDPLDSWVVGYKNFTSDFPLEQLKFTLGDLDTF